MWAICCFPRSQQILFLRDISSQVSIHRAERRGFAQTVISARQLFEKMNKVKQKQLLSQRRCRISASPVFKVIRLTLTVVSFQCGRGLHVPAVCLQRSVSLLHKGTHSREHAFRNTSDAALHQRTDLSSVFQGESAPLLFSSRSNLN